MGIFNNDFYICRIVSGNMPPLGTPAEEVACCSKLQPPSCTPWQVEASPAANILPRLASNRKQDLIADSSCAHSQPSARSSKKSEKRKAVEALLERKASKQRVDSSETMHASNLRSFVVNACDRACASSDESAAISWCSFKVTMPSLDWPAILTTIASNASNPAAEISGHQLPGGVAIHLVESQAQLGPALAALRASMQDGVVAIDLEWRPDYRPGSNNKVALMQLASGTTCVLVRCCRLGYTLPASLLHLFSDPALTFVSFSWDSCDQSKMVSTFGVGKECFARFLDLQQVATTLGYHSIGLASLTLRVLGVTMPKSRSVSRSDWQKPRLSPAQVRYAALDALITGSVFRGLRLWHASPSPCTACRRPFGVEVRIER